MAAYRQGLDQINIKWEGLWTSDDFWQYITSSYAATSPLAVGHAYTIHDTASSMATITPNSS